MRLIRISKSPRQQKNLINIIKEESMVRMMHDVRLILGVVIILVVLRLPVVSVSVLILIFFSSIFSFSANKDHYFVSKSTLESIRKYPYCCSICDRQDHRLRCQSGHHHP
jgi:hypothetical protein